MSWLFATSTDQQPKRMSPPPFPKLEYVAPPSHDSVPDELVSPWTSNSGVSTDECSICLDRLTNGDSVVVTQCSHAFHGKCLNDCFQREKKCPVCRTDMCIQNLSPSGSLEVESTSQVCPGYNPPTTTAIQLRYNIPKGVQRPFHENPGHRHDSTCRVAYLPDNEEGRELLLRMQYAWMRGLTFRIGTSMTSGRRDAVVWTTSFDHKTSLSSGPYGFPDPSYITSTNKKLSDIGVPDKDDCESKLQLMSSSTPRQDGTTAHPPPSAPALDSVGASSAASATTTTAPPSRTSPSPASSNSSDDSDDDSVTFTPPAVTSIETISYAAPSTICQAKTALTSDVVETVLSAPSTEHCAICFEDFSKEVTVKIKKCSHMFHQDCLKRCFQSEARCPVCRKLVGVPQGKCPSGTMTIQPPGSSYGTYRCPGYEPNCSAIAITYDIPSGRQASYHDHPNKRYPGTRRTAYLPNNKDGLSVLLRLKYAWTHGLIFSIGTSMTTGMADQVVWTSIHHKTSLSGGVHGYPDPNYILNVNVELDALDVPDAETCASEV